MNLKKIDTCICITGKKNSTILGRGEVTELYTLKWKNFMICELYLKKRCCFENFKKDKHCEFFTKIVMYNYS